jgi:hypothetical protein
MRFTMSVLKFLSLNLKDKSKKSVRKPKLNQLAHETPTLILFSH